MNKRLKWLKSNHKNLKRQEILLPISIKLAITYNKK